MIGHAEKKYARDHGYDCIVRCKKCGRTQYLEFKMGLLNGWSKCCGKTMSVVWVDADVKQVCNEVMKTSPTMAGKIRAFEYSTGDKAE